MRSKKNFRILFEPIIACVCTCFPLYQTETSKSKIVLSEINIKVICVYTTWHNLTFVSQRVQYYLGKCLNGLYLIGCRNSDFDKFHSNATSDVFLCSNIVSAENNCSVVSTYIFENWKK